MRLFAWQGLVHTHHHEGAHSRAAKTGSNTAEQQHHWLLEFYWWVAFLSAGFITINILLYLFMSYATLPFTNVNGVNVGLKSRAEAIALLDESFNGHLLTVTSDQGGFEYELRELGITVDSTETFERLRDVNGFSSLPIVKLFTNPVINELPTYRLDRDRTATALKQAVDEQRTDPISAQLLIPSLESEPITITESQNGSEISPEIAANQLIASVLGSTSVPSDLTIKPKTIAPSVHESQLVAARSDAEQLLAEALVVTDENKAKVTTVSTWTLRSMLSTDDSGQLRFDDAALSQYLYEELAQYFFVAPVPTRINNGVTTAAGKPGVQLNLEQAQEAFQDQVINDAGTVQLSTLTMEQATVTDGVYPKTDAGLHALIRDFDIEKRGDYRIIVHQLRGGDLRATHNGVQSSIPASTYKAFIAYAAMWATEQGQMSLRDQTSRGTVDACMFEMLHHSTDFCAFAIQDYMGWDRIDKILRINGIENTFTGNEDRIVDKYTTPQDEYKLFRGLYDGTLLNQQHTEKLLDILKGQKWRSGIPGGSSPSVVADKVGFYNGWINDVGIVYGQDADYIIVALSDGGNFWEINDLSRRIYNFFEN